MAKIQTAAPVTVLTVGHSTRDLPSFIELLQNHGIKQLADVRTIPRSRTNPQFNAETLPAELRRAGIRYLPLRELGGLRHAKRDSTNTGWQNASFRGYADYMLEPEFEAGIARLIKAARGRRTAIMCAEAVPWRCHRSLIADALAARGVRVAHILGPREPQVHKMTPFARVEGARVTYPGPLPFEGE